MKKNYLTGGKFFRNFCNNFTEKKCSSSILNNQNNTLNIKSYKHIKSLLFVPGCVEKMLAKSYNINTHVIVPDLEDSVPLSEKQAARDLIKKYLEQISKNGPTGRLVFPRINSLNSSLLEKDLEEILNAQTKDYINGFVIPKLNTYEEFSYIENLILSYEKKLNLCLYSLKLIPWIESTLGMVNMKEIFSQNNNYRIIASAFGAEDFCNDFEISRTEGLKEIEIARSLFAMTSHAYGILAIDTPNVNFKDSQNLINEIAQLKKMGFKGKFAIHPSQVEIINKYFSPSDEEIKWALNIKEKYEIGLNEKKGAIEINGKMVDMPVYKRALNILEKKIGLFI